LPGRPQDQIGFILVRRARTAAFADRAVGHAAVEAGGIRPTTRIALPGVSGGRRDSGPAHDPVAIRADIRLRAKLVRRPLPAVLVNGAADRGAVGGVTVAATPRVRPIAVARTAGASTARSGYPLAVAT